jgi:hypothetical protein
MKKVITAVVAFGLLIAVAASAPADTHSHARLTLVATGKAEIGWVKGPDSPKDPDRWALNMALNGPTFSGYTNAYNNAWLTKDDNGATYIPIGKIRNLSFDFMNASGGAYVSGGAPRVSIVFTNGTVAYLSAYYCDTVIAGGDGTWSRADFTGQTAVGCKFYDSIGGVWESDGTHTAWQKFVAAYPTLKVDYGVVVQDESDTGPMRARIDRIAMYNHMQTSLYTVRYCPTEASC